MRRLAVETLLLLALFAPLSSVAETPKSEVEVLPVEVLSSPRFEGPQYVGADTDGDIYIRRTESDLLVYKLGKNAKFGKTRSRIKG